MQLRNWSDLRYLLAIKRGQSLSAAARRLGVDDTTVARRLASLQEALGVPLCRRQGDGRLQLTSAGEAVAHHAEIIEHHIGLIGDKLGADHDPCAGLVRLTSVPIVVNRLLAPNIGLLTQSHPELHVELIAETRDFNLTRREADLALRLTRPTTGGTQVKARRVAQLPYAAFAARRLSPAKAARLPWISYDEAMAHLPQARWMARAARGEAGGLSPLKVHDAETALEATAAGLGRTLLPSAIAAADPRLRQLSVGDMTPPTRELWLLGHADQLPLARVAAVVAWIDAVVSKAKP